VVTVAIGGAAAIVAGAVMVTLPPTKRLEPSACGSKYRQWTDLTIHPRGRDSVPISAGATRRISLGHGSVRAVRVLGGESSGWEQELVTK
jgi:hypothetical protein